MWKKQEEDKWRQKSIQKPKTVEPKVKSKARRRQVEPKVNPKAKEDSFMVMPRSSTLARMSIMTLVAWTFKANACWLMAPPKQLASLARCNNAMGQNLSDVGQQLLDVCNGPVTCQKSDIVSARDALLAQ